MISVDNEIDKMQQIIYSKMIVLYMHAYLNNNNNIPDLYVFITLPSRVAVEI